MHNFSMLAVYVIAVTTLISNSVKADVVLTFDQTAITDGVFIDPDYGDRVTSASDGIGSYAIVAGAGDLFTPNVEVSYAAGEPRLWTTGYSDLTNVFFNDLDFENAFEITFTANAGFEVGILEFDLGAFGGVTLPGVEILDGDDNVLWSAGSTVIDGATASSFNTGGVFAESLTLSVDLTGLGGASDNIGIDNIRFAQTTAIPEPTSGALLLLTGVFFSLNRRKSRS